MENKVWYKITISTEEQEIGVYPNESFDGVIIETKDLEDNKANSRMHLSESEINLLFLKVKEMIAHVKS